VPHPLIARRTWLWRADRGEVIEAFGFAGQGLAIVKANSPGDAGRRWLAGLAAGPVHEDAVGSRPEGPSLSWIGPRPFTPDEANELRQVARFAAAPLAAVAARATLTAALEAYLGRRSAARVLAGPLRRDIGETIQAALLYADLRGFTDLSERNPPSAVISALDAWFDRIAGPVHAFGGEVLKFIGDGVLAIFPVEGRSPRDACDAALRAVSAARVGMAHLDDARQQQGLPPLPFGAALHLGEMLWGNIGAADRLDHGDRSGRQSGQPAGRVVPAARQGRSCLGHIRHRDRGIADTAWRCVARHRISMRGLHRAGELSRQAFRLEVAGCCDGPHLFISPGTFVSG
jgi:class 3 adenylate cyclase